MDSAGPGGVDTKKVQDALKRLSSPQRSGDVVVDWDTATQFYLALVAIELASPGEKDEAIAARLGEFRERLQFRRTPTAPQISAVR